MTKEELKKLLFKNKLRYFINRGIKVYCFYEEDFDRFIRSLYVD